MEIHSHTMADLFTQLGLDSSEHAMVTFIKAHRLSGNEALDEASFWKPAQAQFIRESWQDDSDWVGLVDQLNTLLRD